ARAPQRPRPWRSTTTSPGDVWPSIAAPTNSGGGGVASRSNAGNEIAGSARVRGSRPAMAGDCATPTPSRRAFGSNLVSLARVPSICGGFRTPRQGGGMARVEPRVDAGIGAEAAPVDGDTPVGHDGPRVDPVRDGVRTWNVVRDAVAR